MHHYPHNIGDFRKDTPHLSPAQKGIYRDLLDYAYATEKPLPDDIDMLSRVCGALKATERGMVGALLREFFVETQHGWEHKRVVAEIKKFYAKSKAGQAGAEGKWYGKPDGEPDGKPDGKPTPRHLTNSIATNTRVTKPSTINQEPSTKGAASADDVDGPTDSISENHDVDPHLIPTGSDASEKKEGGAGVWLDVESDEARRVINRALGRDERRAFTAMELHALGVFAGQHEGQISVMDFAALGRWLLAEPRFDSRNQPAMDAVPEASLLRKRKRFATRVIEDLPNQIEHALAWAAEGQKKEAGAEIPTPTEDKPPGGWRAAWSDLYEFPPPDTWGAVPDSNRADVRLWLNTNTETQAHE